MLMTLLRALSLGLILVLFVPANAEARKSKSKQTRGDSVIVALLKKQSAELEAIRRKQAVDAIAMRNELAEFKKLFAAKQQVVSIDPEALAPEPPRNPVVAIAPMPVPDPNKTLYGYREYVSKIPPAKSGLGNIGGLQKNFLGKLAAMQSDMPDSMRFSVGSGFRSRAQQERLYALKPRLAARPGRSNHERGLAGDLRFSSADAARWVHRNARRYGLRFPMAYEPWHIEPDGLSRIRYARHHRRYAAVR